MKSLKTTPRLGEPEPQKTADPKPAKVPRQKREKSAAMKFKKRKEDAAVERSSIKNKSQKKEEVPKEVS